MTNPVCRTCESQQTELIGPLPVGSVFAGRASPSPLPGGGLWRCSTCHFLFRHPLLPDDMYMRLYREGDAAIWDAKDHREDFRLISQYVAAEKHLPTDVVDIGCYTGQLLQSLPPSMNLFGVEPNAAARVLAEQRNVKVIAETIEEFARSSRQYDLIIACDVIEHVPNPLALMRQLRGRMRIGGRLIITTANSDALLWRIIGADYWYCCFPEHISFIGKSWVRRMAPSVGLKLSTFTSFNYRGGHVRLARMAAALLHRIAPRIYRTARPPRPNSTSEAAPPGSGATRDHMLCVFEAY